MYTFGPVFTLQISIANLVYSDFSFRVSDFDFLAIDKIFVISILKTTWIYQ